MKSRRMQYPAVGHATGKSTTTYRSFPRGRFSSAYLLITFCLAFSLVLPRMGCAQEVAASDAKPDSVALVLEKVAALNKFLGSYPPRITSEAEHVSVNQQWDAALKDALQLPIDQEKTLFALSELYRQGHNMDEAGTARKAMKALEACSFRFPDSVMCNRSCSYLYLSLSREYAPKGEKCLLKLRELAKPGIDDEAERGLIFASISQGKTKEALKLADDYLKLFPDDKFVKKMHDALVSGKIGVKDIDTKKSDAGKK